MTKRGGCGKGKAPSNSGANTVSAKPPHHHRPGTPSGIVTTTTTAGNNSAKTVSQAHLLWVPGEAHPRQAQLKYTTSVKQAPMHISLVIDTSPSMAGSSISNVMDQCTEMLKKAQRIRKSTVASVYHFDSFLKRVIKGKPVSDIQFDRLKWQAQEDASRGGGTAMYDAIHGVMDNIKAHHASSVARQEEPPHYFLAVFTDGEDNTSYHHSLSDTQRLVASPGLPNFHFFIISAGVPKVVKKQINQLIAGKRHCKHFPAQSTSKAELDKAFKEFTKQMEEVLTLTVRGAGGAQPVVPQMMDNIRSGFGRMNLKSSGAGRVMQLQDGGHYY